MVTRVLRDFFLVALSSQIAVAVGSTIIAGLLVPGLSQFFYHLINTAMSVSYYSWPWVTGAAMLFGYPLFLVTRNAYIGLLFSATLYAVGACILGALSILLVFPGDYYPSFIWAFFGLLYGAIYGAVIYIGRKGAKALCAEL